MGSGCGGHCLDVLAIQTHDIESFLRIDPVGQLGHQLKPCRPENFEFICFDSIIGDAYATSDFSGRNDLWSHNGCGKT